MSRRGFLRAGTAGGMLALGGGLLAACDQGDTGAVATPVPPDGTPATAPAHPIRHVPFEGTHQAGITAHPVPAVGLMAAFRVTSADRDGLREMFASLTAEIRALMAGDPIEQRDPAYPPADSGLLGVAPGADNLTVVASVGASLFDGRYGLAERRPRELVEMPFLANDRLDPDRSHGDLLLTIEAEHPDTVQFALRQLMRATRRHLVLAWMVDGYTRGSTPSQGAGSPRNLLGFKDGSANLSPRDQALMDEFVWVAADDDEPDWATGGSYHVARQIRMFVEFWDRTPLAEQEAVIGRHKVSGAPLGASAEADLPDYTGDPDGELTPLDAHIRLANPRTSQTHDSLLLRRGFSYARGFDRAGQLDQGLAFVSYQRSLERGFLTVQGRLDGEPLEEYILPEGGGFFFALPGVRDADSNLADPLLA